MIQLLKNLFNALRPLFESVIPFLREVPLKQKIPVSLKNKGFDFPKNLEANRKAIEYLKAARPAFLAGYHKWTKGDVAGIYYNNILLCRDGKEYYLVKRQFDAGILHEITTDTISKSEYEKAKTLTSKIRIGGDLSKSRKVFKYDTYCNFAAGIFFQCHTYGNIFCNYKKTLQYYKKERSANGIIKALAKGVYDVDNIGYKCVNPSQALSIANSGGYVLATFLNRLGRGHVATLTGNFVEKRIEIFQAGATDKKTGKPLFGQIPISYGFGRYLSKVKFYARVYT